MDTLNSLRQTLLMEDDLRSFLLYSSDHCPRMLYWWAEVLRHPNLILWNNNFLCYFHNDHGTPCAIDSISFTCPDCVSSLLKSNTVFNSSAAPAIRAAALVAAMPNSKKPPTLLVNKRCRITDAFVAKPLVFSDVVFRQIIGGLRT